MDTNNNIANVSAKKATEPKKIGVDELERMLFDKNRDGKVNQEDNLSYTLEQYTSEASKIFPQANQEFFEARFKEKDFNKDGVWDNKDFDDSFKETI